MPSRLLGFEYEDGFERHSGGRDDFAEVLRQLAVEYSVLEWVEAAAYLEQSAQALEKLTGATVDYILDESDSLEPAAHLVAHIADLEEQAYRVLNG